MDFENLGIYINFSQLNEKLTYLHTSNKIYCIYFDNQQNNGLFMFFDSNKRKYNFYFKFEDEKIENDFSKIEKENVFSEIPNKMSFSELLRNKIDKLIKILQKHGYRLTYTPEVNLFDLENLSLEIEENQVEETQSYEKIENLKKNKIIFNKVILYHNITALKLLNEPTIKNGKCKILINSMKKSDLDLFPRQDRIFKNVQLEVSAIPNIYFPQISIIKIIKTFEFKDIDFEIIYEGQNFSNTINLIAKEYYDSYKKTPDDRYLNLSLKLVEIVKNPYSSKNLTNTNGENIITQSNCKKCGSSSGIFNVKLSNVKIKTFMGKFETANLLPSNILSYKDILEIKCFECGNTIIEDQSMIKNIEKRRQYLTSENWISFENGKPILDSDGEELIIHYDLMELEVEFDSTNPILPILNYNKIKSVGKITGWSNKDGNKSKTFYDR